MNKDDVQDALALSLTKAECLSRMGLEHSLRNYKELSTIISKNNLDASHLQGIKASTYIKNFLTNTEVVV